jgi:hypothetical protein
MVDIYNITLSNDTDIMSLKLCNVSIFDSSCAGLNNVQGKILNTQKKRSLQQKRVYINYQLDALTIIYS